MPLIRKHGAVLQAWACLALVLFPITFTCFSIWLTGPDLKPIMPFSKKVGALT